MKVIIKWFIRLRMIAGIVSLGGILYYFYDHSRFNIYIYATLITWIIGYIIKTRIDKKRKSL